MSLWCYVFENTSQGISILNNRENWTSLNTLRTNNRL